MASNIDESVPQWKKELILRKRAQQPVLSQHSRTDGTNRHWPPPHSNKCPPKQASTGRHQAAVRPSSAVGVHGARSGARGTGRHTPDLQQGSRTSPIDVPSVHPVGAESALATSRLPRDEHMNVRRCPLTMVADNLANGGGEESDSSEELQYGPGIVSKLKSKYLSLTLRETNAKPRPSVLPLRRATSLENLLDAGSGEDESNHIDITAASRQPNGKPPPPEKTSVLKTLASMDNAIPTRRYAPRADRERNGTVKTVNTRYRNTSRGNESTKRARSVETLLRSVSAPLPDQPNDDVVIADKDGRRWPENKAINRPKRIAPLLDDAERPPADHVKQTKRLFEGPAPGRTRSPRLTGDVAAKVANFKHIIDQERPKKVISPGEKTRRPAPSIPTSTPPDISRTTGSAPPADATRGVLCETPDLILHSSPAGGRSPACLRRVTADFIQVETEFTCKELSIVEAINVSPKITENIVKATILNHVEKTPITNKAPITIECNEEPPTEPLTKPVNNLVITSQMLNKAPIRNCSPSPDEHSKEVSRQNIENINRNKSIMSKIGLKVTKSLSPVPSDEYDGFNSKEVPKQAIENISKAGNSVTFAISDNIPKSHLPKLNSVSVRINKLVPDLSPKPAESIRLTPKVEPERHISPPAPSYAPVIPLSSPIPTISPVATSSPVAIVQIATPPPVTSPIPEMNGCAEVRKVSPKQNGAPRPAAKPLTSREIEKNMINRAKTLEQPVSKVVVSVLSVEDVVVHKNMTGVLKSTRKSVKGPEQNTFKFDFKDRDTVPDYIPHDDVIIRRGKREKPKAGDSGYKIMPGAPLDQFVDEEELWKQELSGPPSPCDVLFENDNILIDGKSSIKQSRRQKMRIQFDDDATETFLYPSESSLLEDPASPVTSPASSSPSVSAPPTSATGTPGHSVPSLTGSSLSSYTPSKMVSSGFQLGVTRTTQPIVTPPMSAILEPELPLYEPLVPVTYSAETNADILF